MCHVGYTARRIVPSIEKERCDVAKNGPEKVIRIGSVSASIFANQVKTESGPREMRNVNLQRRYKDGDEWKSATTFGLSDLPNDIHVLQLALQHIEAAEMNGEPF